VDTLSDAFENSEGRVSPLISGFLVGQFQYSWFIQEDSSYCDLTQEPEFCQLPHRIVLFYSEDLARFIGQSGSC
jgi:hypothetical protein